MRPSEARHVGALLQALPRDALEPCLNIGSSTAAFRTVEQPHVDAHVFKPLRERGITIYNVDMKEAEGVDLVGNVLSPDFQATLRALEPRLVMCSNILEHLVDPRSFARACGAMVPPGGHLLVSGPHSYPYHLDPIDTLYRPGPDEMRALFGLEIVSAAIVPDTTYLDDLRRRYRPPALAAFLARQAAAFPYLLATDRERFKARYHRYLWLFRPFTSAVALLRRPAEPGDGGGAAQ